MKVHIKTKAEIDRMRTACRKKMLKAVDMDIPKSLNRDSASSLRDESILTVRFVAIIA